MRIVEFLEHLRALGVELRADGDRLTCNAPKGVVTPELADGIRTRKAEILAFLAHGDEVRQADRPPLRPSGRPGPFPLSYSQQRVWFIESLGGAGALYNAPAAFRMRGPLDVDALRRGILEIIRRHDVMRTGIEVRGGHPVQVVVSGATIDIPLVHITGERALDRVMDHLAEQSAIPFRLEQAPLFRAQIIALGADDHVLFFMPHHIIWDGWSFDVFLAELKVLYEAYVVGGPSPLPEPPIQYSDYTLWQRDWLEGGELQRQLAYWQQKLAGELPVLALPADFARPATRSVDGGRLIRVMSQDFADRLTALAREEGATLYMALLAAYKILLCRYTGQEDVIVGAPMASNAASETETMVGFFVNTIVLRTDLSGDPSYREVLRRVQETCMGAFGHQDVPFEKLVEALKPARDLSRTPIHQTEFGLQEASRRPRSFGPLKLEQLIVQENTVGTDVIFWVKTDRDCLPLAMDYAATLFARQTIEELLENLETLLSAALAMPDTNMSRLPLLTDRRRQEVLELGRGPGKSAPPDCIHERIEARARATPEAVALVHRRDRVSYRQLDERANQLAHHLIAAGVGRDGIVGVCLDRGIDTITALLAIHKAGGAYLPLDPTYPLERLLYMIADAGVVHVVTQRRFEELVDGAGGVSFLDELADGLARLPTQKPDVRCSPEQLAYAIYTSGSTGKPKGVLVEHRNVTNFIAGIADLVPFAPTGCWLAVTSISFDISVLELFGSLMHGFTVVLYDGFRGTADEGETIATLIARHRVTHLQCTPSQARMVITDVATRAALGRVEHLLVGGEALPVDLAQELRSLCRRVVNVYGPTETTVWSTAWVVERDAARIPIGRPLANQHVYVLDRLCTPVPRGVIGELYIGGAGVARGYLDRAELTNERFLADPFGPPGSRMYRTGDLVRWDREGRLEFHGRADGQVKLLGHRIELGELEVALRKRGSIGEAAAIVREDRAGDPRLIAYVTAANGVALDANEIRDELRRTLPRFMVPSAIVVLPAIPKTPNGKIDRRALQEAPGAEAAPPRIDREAARNDAELILTRIWEGILGVADIGIHDNFFDLGGTSFGAIRCVSEFEATTGLRIELGEIFRTPTIAELAKAHATEERASRRLLIPLCPEATGPNLFCVLGIWIYSHLAGEMRDCCRTLGAYVSEEQLLVGYRGQTPHPMTIERLAAAYVEALTAAQPDGPYHLAGLSFGGVVAMEIANQLVAKGRRVENVILLDTLLPTGYRHLGWRAWAHAARNRFRALMTSLGRLGLPGFRRRGNKGGGGYDVPVRNREAEIRSWMHKWQGCRPQWRTTLVRATDDSEWGSHVRFETDYGWSELIGQPVPLMRVHGGHIGILSPPNVAALAAGLSQLLRGDGQDPTPTVREPQLTGTHM
ncbi:MAG: amino acid adenylation domain-containing protein [Planctomycetota bacterium]